MNSTTSTEFIEWMMVLNEMEWEEKTKTDYYLAQIAMEIRQFREGFAKTPKRITIQDCLIPFTPEDDTQTVKDSKPAVAAPAAVGVPAPGGVQYECGAELVKDPKWAKVNAIAKSHWAALMGVRDLSELPRGDTA